MLETGRKTQDTKNTANRRGKKQGPELLCKLPIRGGETEGKRTGGTPLPKKGRIRRSKRHHSKYETMPGE